MLTLIDAKEVLDNLKSEYANAYLAYFVQEDILDFHVFRVMKGDYDENQDVYTVEYEKIPKDNVIQVLEIDLGGLDIREAFTYIDKLDTVKAIIEVDADLGFENWDFHVVNTLKEAIDAITENGFYSLEKMLYEDTKKVKTYNEDAFHYYGSLEEAKDLLEKLMQDERAKHYEGVEVRSYQNCREQGYALHYKNRNSNEQSAITFSEQRNSDSIVIYHGTPRDTSISDDAYLNSNHFRYRHFNAAKHYIFSLLETNAPLSEKENAIDMHEGLKIANNVLENVFSDERSKITRAYVEGLQEGDINGYSIIFFDKQFNGHAIGISGNSHGDIVLYFGRNEFRGLSENISTETYSNTNMQEVVNRIYVYIQEKMKNIA